jgi:hypothetical protein
MSKRPGLVIDQILDRNGEVVVEVYETRNLPLRRQRFKFRILAANGEVIHTSEPYVSETNAGSSLSATGWKRSTPCIGFGSVRNGSERQ